MVHLHQSHQLQIRTSMEDCLEDGELVTVLEVIPRILRQPTPPLPVVVNPLPDQATSNPSPQVPSNPVLQPVASVTEGPSSVMWRRTNRPTFQYPSFPRVGVREQAYPTRPGRPEQEEGEGSPTTPDRRSDPERARAANPGTRKADRAQPNELRG
ncbi:hypothetical protein SKAU_G00018770 [Synaphobranchus kaupii]|uniref:Uncharacterized protein n=1 Tax=Synaphobranchus kaupii TaxID=118154 RepID=A0A9Q1GCR8_SYNKA|nr:hypothetical protein SKAU_G00018770 [Synaphobranchus kaupii]